MSDGIHARRIPLASTVTPGQLLRRVEGWDGLVGLVGDWAGGTAVLTSHPVRVAAGDPLAALDDQPVVAGSSDAALIGGGWFGRLDFAGPSRLGFYDHLLRLVDGGWQFEALPTPEREAALAERLMAWRAVLQAAEVPRTWRVGEFGRARPAAAPDAPPLMAGHLAAVEQAVELVRAGELYQVNVCTRLGADFAGSAATLFADAAAALEPRYGAFLGGTQAVASFSPELFLRRRGRSVLSEPIKGTAPRGVPGADAALRRSAKDAAENVMIVDLVRNDLGRVCEIGTVRPVALLEVQPHPGVWHFVSAVEGRLRPEVGDAGLLRAAFPPGSVTGAPKLRALAAIADLEPVGRGTYTGAIGFASPLWGAEFSVAIRTFEIADGRIELGVGGGIVADSVPMLEWRECLHKAAPLVHAAGSTFAAALRPAEPPAGRTPGGLLETILCLDGAAVRLADHLGRLDRSSRELYGAALPDDVGERVRRAAGSRPIGRSVLRVTVVPEPAGPPQPAVEAELARSPEPAVAVTITPAAEPPAGSELVTMLRPDGLWRHKWADRGWAVPGLYLAADGTVLETDRGNVFLIEADGTLVTAPLRDDLLPGITRRALLDRARDAGRPTVLRGFELAELRTRPAFWTSSLSGVVPIDRLDGVALPRADALVRELSAGLLDAVAPARFVS